MICINFFGKMALCIIVTNPKELHHHFVTYLSIVFSFNRNPTWFTEVSTSRIPISIRSGLCDVGRIVVQISHPNLCFVWRTFGNCLSHAWNYKTCNNSCNVVCKHAEAIQRTNFLWTASLFQHPQPTRLEFDFTFGRLAIVKLHR